MEIETNIGTGISKEQIKNNSHIGSLFYNMISEMLKKDTYDLFDLKAGKAIESENSLVNRKIEMLVDKLTEAKSEAEKLELVHQQIKELNDTKHLQITTLLEN